jgi:hypothetical protein
MRFFRIEVRTPCPFHSASEQARDWDKAQTMLIAVADSGERFYRLLKHQTGVNTPRIKGGRWEVANKRTDFSGAIECDLPKGIKPPKKTERIK